MPLQLGVQGSEQSWGIGTRGTWGHRPGGPPERCGAGLDKAPSCQGCHT